MPPSGLLAPGASGWFLCGNGGGETAAGSLEEAAASLKASDTPFLAIPSHLSILERFMLPSVDSSELEGMLLLQLEKSLPFPVSDISFGYQIISQKRAEESKAGGDAPSETVPVATEPEIPAGGETTLIATVVNQSAVEALVNPLTERGIYPSGATLLAMLVSKQVPQQGASAAFWKEEGRIIFAVFDEGILCFLEVIDSEEELEGALSYLPMSASLADAPAQYGTLLLDTALSEQKGIIENALFANVVEFQAAKLDLANESSLGGDLVDLTLPAWNGVHQQRAKREVYKARAIKAVGVYAALVVVALLALGVQQLRFNRLKAKYEGLQPQVAELTEFQNRWQQMDPVVNLSRYTLELLLQAAESLPSQETRITLFEVSPRDLRLEVEAPNASEAVRFGEALVEREGFKDFGIKLNPPSVLNNDKAHLRLTGKL